MKRIVNGVTYNTETSTRIAISAWQEDDNTKVSQQLFQTRGAAFFIVESRTEKSWSNDEREYIYDETNSVRPISRENAQGWMMKGQVEVVDPSVFGEPPEAVAEENPGATIYLRVPASLKERLEALAKRDDSSLNSWTMRCVERCTGLDKVGEKLGILIGTGQQLTAETDDASFSTDTLRQIVALMVQHGKAVAAILGWEGEKLRQLIDAAQKAPGYRRLILTHHSESPLSPAPAKS